MAGKIAKDGSIIIPVKIKYKGKEFEKELLADTGARATILPRSNFLEKIGKFDKEDFGLLHENNFGKQIELKNADMEVEVEDHGTGNPEKRNCDKMRLHLFTDDEAKKIFAGAVGLLGMEQFDNLKADPVKSADGKKAYMAKRK